MRRSGILIAVVWVLAPLSWGQSVAVSLVDETGIKARLESGAVGAGKRQATIRTLFESAGCAVTEQAVNKFTSNVICTLPGETTDEIVVGGHFDFLDNGRGIVDDWSGTSLLPSLYEALKGQPRRHTYVFVAFAAAERGLAGSSYYVNHLTAQQRSQIKAFVSLWCLGLTSTKVSVRHSVPFLVDRLIDTALHMGMKVEGVNLERISDARSFLSAKIPLVLIHSFTQGTLGILHSTRDNEAAIHFDDYYASYKLVAFYLGFLDVKI